MRITLRLTLSLAVVMAAVASLFAYWQVHQEKERQKEELQRRSSLLGESLQETVQPLLESGSTQKLQKLVEKFGNRERLAGVAVYDAQQNPVAMTSSLASSLSVAPQPVSDSIRDQIAINEFESLQNRKMDIYSQPLRDGNGTIIGALALFHDATYIQDRLNRMMLDTFVRTLIQTVFISIVVLLVIRWSFAGPIVRMVDWMKKLRAGESIETFTLPQGDLFTPIFKEVTTFARHLSDAKAAAEEEAKLRRTAETLWTPERLKEHVKAKLNGKPLFVVSNREPYVHLRQGRKKIEVMVPAGGLVTALEPVLRSCGGTWIAQGSGDADWEVVDGKNRIRVPPEDPLYTLKRVPLTKEEENGYYYGFSNEGIWPLCHIAHTRPLFRSADWTQYQKVNQKFADAVLEELEDVAEPCILVQDYHFALLPRLLKKARPDSRIALFWHIPWPNSEAFGICPWQREILEGMLGSDLIGFHTQFHCNNFLDTVDRTLESRIDLEHFTVHREEHSTLVKPFPISVAFPSAFQDISPAETKLPDHPMFLKELGIKSRFLGVGVDRIDYTKGILERFLAIERLLDKYPKYQENFTFVQIGAPSRTHIKRYHDFLGEVEVEAERINWKFKTKEWKPIFFLKKHHSHSEILPFYQRADICIVSSLHDGMNLVAKEFVASRNDNGGVLILSRFAGASRELRDALIVNPYDIDQTAEAIRYALEIDPEEKFDRMTHLRETVKEHNIYRWAGNLIEELTQIRLKHKTVRSS